jgi:1-acyl-sn-glycerol-3-phosphate acyltransferase
MRALLALLALWRVLRVVLHVLHGMAVAAVVFPRTDASGRQARIGWWSAKFLRLLGVQLQAHGAFRPGAGLLVINHVSWLDILAVHAVCPRARFVSKADVKHWPLLGWLVAAAGTLFIERERKRDALRVVHQMAEAMRSGDLVAVFPEGTTSDGRSVRRFLPSLLQPAVELNCPIVPAALRYRTLNNEYSATPAYIDQMSLWQSLKHIVSEPGLIAELHFGEPILPNGHRRDMAAQAEAATARLLGVLPADTSPQSPADPPA